VTSRHAAVLIAVLAIAGSACRREANEPEENRPSRTERRIDEQLAPASAVPQREGLAAAILIDVSGSMDEEVEGADGREARKIDVARRAARDLVAQFARYADDHPGEPVLLGLYEFSERSGQPDCRPVIDMAAPDRARADAALERMRAQGGTPIGNAMITAKRALDLSGLSRRHLLVVTDGENTDGFAPDDVTAVINKRPESERPSIYFVAFDIDERRFARVRDAGALLLGASDARDLNDTLDSLLRGQILIEK
jgi:Mg-chelatase subunit ChlD